MQLTVSEWLSLSILPAAVISGIRIRRTDASFLPFVLLLWIGAANELLSIFLMASGQHTTINNNVYVLLEALVVLWLFYRLGEDRFKLKIFVRLILFLLLVWMMENAWLGSIRATGFYFRLIYSFMIVVLSINRLNYLLFHESGHLLRSPSFLMSVCFVIFFTYKILTEAFWISGLENTSNFRNSVYTLMVYLNFVVNLVFVLVALWIPEKQKHLLFS